MKNPHPPALRKAIKDYKKYVKSKEQTAAQYDKAHEKLNDQLRVLQNRLAANAANKAKRLSTHKSWIDQAVLTIMNEANNAKLNASTIILSLHATNTTTGQPRA